MAAELTRNDFDKDFVFGAATSAMQLEGAYKADSRSMSVWDAFSINQPNKILEGGNTCVAIDHYHRFRDDVKLMKKMGLDAYRFSISWSRILPGGQKSAGINNEGVKFYSDLIDCLLEHGIEPYVTIFHFDVPQCLEELYGGFLDRRIVDDFADYAEICFFEFGDRVKNWITINESWTFTHHGYISKNFPPGHGSDTSAYFDPVPNIPRSECITRHRMPVVPSDDTVGDPARECYIVAHHLILAHGYAVDRYKKHYQAVQGGKIGVTNMTSWYYPRDPSNPNDVAAAERAVEFQLGWFVRPVVFGDYPKVMKDRVTGGRLPEFSDDEKKIITKSFDFLGLNYYTSNFVSFGGPTSPTNYYSDQQCIFWTYDVDGRTMGVQAGSTWLYNVPSGLYDFLVDTKKRYDNPLIFITENGWDEKNDRAVTVTKGCHDDLRITYHKEHLDAVHKAINNQGVNVKAYFAWSLFDNFELAEGYTVRFGMIYVDYVNNFNRYPKKSAIWYMNFLNKKANLLRNKRDVEDGDEVATKTGKRARGGR